MNVAALSTAPPTMIAMLAIVYKYFHIEEGRIFSSLRYCFSGMLPAITAVNFTKFITLELGSAVNVSFTVFLAIQPIPAARPVIVAASITLFTSLVSYIYIYIYKLNLFHSISRMQQFFFGAGGAFCTGGTGAGGAFSTGGTGAGGAFSTCGTGAGVGVYCCKIALRW